MVIVDLILEEIIKLKPLDKNTAEWRRELEKVRYMKDRVIRNKIYRSNPEDLYRFAEALEEVGKSDFAQEARKRLKSLGYEWDEDLGSYVANIDD
jgi:hypothetical protein